MKIKKASNSIIPTSILLVFSIIVFSSTVTLAQQLSGINEQQIRTFLQLSPSRQQAILNKISPSDRQLIESALGGKGIQAAQGQQKKTVTTGVQPVQGTATQEEIHKVTTEEEMKKEAVEKKPRKHLFDRYRPVEKYQAISTDLKPFGYDFFEEVSADMELMTPRTDIPASSDYIIGPGDEIVLKTWGRMEGEYYLIVDRDGTVSVPNVGPMKVAGMTFKDMKKHVTAEVEKIFGAKANVSMGGLKTIKVFVLGEVKKPGMYPLDSLSTIMNALLAAGGPSDIGSLRKIELKRNNKTIAVMDIYDLLLNGDKSQDKILLSGDVVFVPTVGPLVGVAGNVKRPAIYEIKDRVDLNTIFEMAGGIIPSAYTQQIQVERIKKHEKEIVIDINEKELPSLEKFMIHDGDMIKVFSIQERIENYITITGNVKRPGIYEYKPGMRIRDLIKDKNDLLPETYLNYAVIKRHLPPDYNVEVISFNLGEAISGNNIELKPRDEIYIFSEWLFKERPFVTVQGEVRKMESNNELKDIILQYRELKEKVAARISKNEKVPLEMTLAIEHLEQKAEEKFPFSTDILRFKLRELQAKEKEIESKESKASPAVETEIESVKQEIENIELYSKLITTKSRLNALVTETDEIRSKGIKIPQDLEDEINALQNEIETKASDSALLTRLRLQELRIRIADLESSSKTDVFNFNPEDEIIRPFTTGYIKVPIFENTRVKDAIMSAGGFTQNAYLKKCEIIRTDKTGQSSQIYFDAQKAMAGDSENNILLNDQDRIIIHSKQEIQYKQTVTVKGEVTNPGTYPLTEGMKISDLVFAAGNLLESAYLDEAEVSMFIPGEEGTNVLRSTVNLKKALAGDPEDNITLAPDCELLVKKIPDWGVKSYANIEGEIKFPGRYNIKKGERLSSLIERAGGFTNNAYLRGAVFTRERVRKLQQDQLNEVATRLQRQLLERSLVQTTSLLNNEVQSVALPDLSRQQQFIARFKELKAKGRVTITLLPLNVLKGSSYDIVLEADDTIYIPTNPHNIQVMGAVYNQTAFQYDPNKDYMDYIDLAAGFTDMADKSKIYILKTDGTAVRTKRDFSLFSWNKDNDRWEVKTGSPLLESGDSIIVPIVIEKISWLRSIKDLTSVLYQTAITVGVVDNLFNIFGN